MVITGLGWIGTVCLSLWALYWEVYTPEIGLKAAFESHRMRTESALTELAETVGGMDQLFGNAEILPGGDDFTASVNIHSDAVRWYQTGRRLTVTNTGDRREMSVTVTVEGKFEGEPHLFLNLSAAAGRAIGAPPRSPEDENQDPVEIQISVELFREEKADD